MKEKPEGPVLSFSLQVHVRPRATGAGSTG